VSTEEWRPIPGYSRYEASNEGRIRKAVDSAVLDVGVGKRAGELLEPTSNGRGYGYVCVLPDGYDWRAVNPTPPVRVSHLVALAFLGPVPEGCEVGHRDMDPANDRADNIVYRTPAERRAATKAAGRGPGRKPGTHALTHEQVNAVRERRKSGEKVRDIARDYPEHCLETVRRASINHLGRTWTGKPPHRLKTLNPDAVV
jgi:hypothetical protein